MPTSRQGQHRKPEVPREALEAERVARHMYNALSQKTAPKATSGGYIMGTAMVFKILIDQAVQQGGDRAVLKQQALAIIQDI